MSLLWCELKVKLAFPCSRCACCWSMVFESTFFSRKISPVRSSCFCVCFFFFFFFFATLFYDPKGKHRQKRQEKQRRSRGAVVKKNKERDLYLHEQEGTRGHDTNREEKKNKGPQRRIIEGRRKEKQSRPRRHFSSVIYIYITYIYIFTHELKHT
jgi:hypothetical protein